MNILSFCLSHALPLESSIWSHIIYNHVFSFASGLCSCVFLTSTDAPCCWAVLGQSRFSWLCLSWRWVWTANLRAPPGSSCPSKVGWLFGFLLICFWFSFSDCSSRTLCGLWFGGTVWTFWSILFFTCYLLVFMTEFDELINVFRFGGKFTA